MSVESARRVTKLILTWIKKTNRLVRGSKAMCLRAANCSVRRKQVGVSTTYVVSLGNRAVRQDVDARLLPGPIKWRRWGARPSRHASICSFDARRPGKYTIIYTGNRSRRALFHGVTTEPVSYKAAQKCDTGSRQPLRRPPIPKLCPCPGECDVGSRAEWA